MAIARLLKKHVVMLTLLKPLGLFFIGPFQDVVDKLRPLSLKFQKGEFSFQYSKQS